MAIDWTQEQAIPSTFVGGYQSFTPDVSGFVIASVEAQGETTSQLGLALVGDSVVNMWVAGGTYVYSGSSTASLPGNATFPVAANNTFLLGAFNYSSPDSPPAFYFWWVPAAAASTAYDEREQAARREEMIALAERTKPSLLASLQEAAAS